MLVVFFNAIIASIVNLSIWSKLSEIRLNFRNIKVYIGIVFMIAALMTNSIMVEPILKIIVVLFISTCTIMLMYELSLKEAMILSIITQLLYVISELLVIIVVLIITNINSNKQLVDIFFGTIYANIAIGALVYIIIQIPFIKKIYDKLLSLLQNQKIYNITLIVILVIVTISVALNFIFYRNNLILMSFIGLMLLIAYLVFIMNNIVIRNNYLNMHIKYNDTLETLKSYEDILDKYKVSNHENKNQLLMIRNMLRKDSKNDISKYIDNIVQNEYKDDENLMFETSKIPSGGLRALIYSKMLYMKNNNVNFFLKIDKKIRTIQLSNMKEETILDLCKIIGVFLDNSIEEVAKIGKGTVGIELYLINNKLNISISNSFEGSIDLDKISELKYTTKGNGHGYGLALVKDIISKNKHFKNLRMVNDDIFTQILRIDI